MTKEEIDAAKRAMDIYANQMVAEERQRAKVLLNALQKVLEKDGYEFVSEALNTYNKNKP